MRIENKNTEKPTAQVIVMAAYRRPQSYMTAVLQQRRIAPGHRTISDTLLAALCINPAEAVLTEEQITQFVEVM